MTDLSLQPVHVAGLQGEARLVFSSEGLAAVLVRLGEEQGEHAGWWFLEAAFGRLETPSHPVFPTLEDAGAWITEQLRRAGPR